nr:hypothetical protein Itr_chr03CG04010 [Ipomoea trifida]
MRLGVPGNGTASAEQRDAKEMGWSLSFFNLHLRVLLSIRASAVAVVFGDGDGSTAGDGLQEASRLRTTAGGDAQRTWMSAANLESLLLFLFHGVTLMDAGGHDYWHRDSATAATVTEDASIGAARIVVGDEHCLVDLPLRFFVFLCDSARFGSAAMETTVTGGGSAMVNGRRQWSAVQLMDGAGSSDGCWCCFFPCFFPDCVSVSGGSVFGFW